MLFALQQFGQSFDPGDIALVGFLIVLEGVLSIDNALVLGILAKRLPKHQQGKALWYGLIGAFVFRVIAIALANLLFRMHFVKLLGGGYLVYIAVRHLFFESKEQIEATIVVNEEGGPEMRDPETGAPLTKEQEQLELDERVPVSTGRQPSFWGTVAVIELTDMAFAVDSIMAAIGLVVGHQVNPNVAFHPKLWVVVTGGLLGLLLMRVAAAFFIRLLQRFPRFEVSAYLLVIVIGGKLLLDWWFNPGDEHVLNFHSPAEPEFWAFWILMLVCFMSGFLPEKSGEQRAES